jgi:translation elongation factor EF-Tu-like GTPase
MDGAIQVVTLLTDRWPQTREHDQQARHVNYAFVEFMNKPDQVDTEAV